MSLLRRLLSYPRSYLRQVRRPDSDQDREGMQQW